MCSLKYVVSIGVLSLLAQIEKIYHSFSTSLGIIPTKGKVHILAPKVNLVWGGHLLGGVSCVETISP